MKFLLIFSIITTTVVGNDEKWMQFKFSHKKIYSNIQEEKLRYTIFQENVIHIENHNKQFYSGESSYKMAINKFADLTFEEYNKMLGSKPKVDVDTFEQKKFASVHDVDIPKSIDWSKTGAVTEVKDQGSCGSCWSFSVTGAIEGQNFLNTGRLISLSQQEMVDCDDTCQGCKGGWLDDAMKWVQTNGLMTDNSYPYEGIQDACRFDNKSVAVRIDGYNAVKPNDEIELQKAVAVKGPIAVAIFASYDFRFYSSGVFDDNQCPPGLLNHGVLVVGYNTTEDGIEHWIVKNSWGTDWGEEGYVRMSRNKNNQCGIAQEPFYSIISK